jgi:hypothetical protein
LNSKIQPATNIQTFKEKETSSKTFGYNSRQ